MRWYRITIGTGTNKIILDSQDMLKGGCPLQVEFNITGYKVEKGATQDISSLIKIYGMPLGLHKKLLSYAPKYSSQNIKIKDGEFFKLEAGFIKSPLTKKLGYFEVANKCLVEGEIKNIVGNYEPLDSYILITTLGFENIEIDKLDNSYLSRYFLHLAPGEDISNTLQSHLKYFIPKTWKINWSKDWEGVINNNKETRVWQYSTLNELLKIMQGEFEIGIIVDYQKKCLNIGYNFESNAYTINPGDLLSQPEVLGYSTSEGKYTYSLVSILRPDIGVGSIINLKGDMINSLAGNWTDKNYLQPTNLNLLKNGKYMVSAINHIGNFYGTEPSSWSSQMQISPVGE